MKRTVLASALLAVFAIPSVALATDGYFPHGYGMKAKGMGGASVAMADDSFGGANNPASMVFAGTASIWAWTCSARNATYRVAAVPASVPAWTVR